MLSELKNIRQHADEPRRRWFFSHEQDLIVWYDEAGDILSFQLCYAKYLGERAICWRRERGFSHLKVDDGEISPVSNSTPILVADGVFNSDKVAAQFRVLALEVPPDVVEFVLARLLEFSVSQR